MDRKAHLQLLMSEGKGLSAQNWIFSFYQAYGFVNREMAVCLSVDLVGARVIQTKQIAIDQLTA